MRPSLWQFVGSLRRLALAALASVLLAALLGFVVARRAIRPLARLTEAARRAAAFETAQIAPLPEGGLAETADATRAVNRLIESHRLADALVPRRLALALARDPTGAAPRRVVVTAMATGLAGFADAAGWLGDDAAVALLRRRLTLLAGRIEKTEGVVRGIAGDGLVAILGAPEAQTDHAARAIETVRQIGRFVAEDEALREVSEAPSPGLRIGIATGEAIVGDLGPAGRTTFAALGPVVPLAQRLEWLAHALDEAPPVVVLADAASAAAADQATSLGRHAIGEDKSEIEVFRL